MSAEVKDTLRIGRAWIRGPFQRQNYYQDKKLFFVLLRYLLLTTSKLLLLLFHFVAYLLSMIFLLQKRDLNPQVLANEVILRAIEVVQ